MFPIVAYSLFLETEVPVPAGAVKPPFRAGATITVLGRPQPVNLNLEVPEEFAALCNMLSTPGQLFFNPNGMTVVKSWTNTLS